MQKDFRTRLEEERSGTVALENSHVRAKSVFNLANRQLKEIPARKQLCHNVMNNPPRMKSQENMDHKVTFGKARLLS